MNLRLPMAVLVASGVLTGCGLEKKGLTREEAGESVEETRLAVEASSLTGNTIEITTNFTIGDAVAQAAEEVRDFYATNLPCAEVTLEGNTLTVEYGKTSDTCLYRGQRITGAHAVTIQKNDEGQVLVDHVWTDLSNEVITVSGTASVTWQGGADPSRHVEHELTWTRLSDGRQGIGSGNLTQRPLDGDIAVGFVQSGTRRWQGKSGTWDLTIDDLEIRWVDPVPQAGSYEISSPFDKELTLSFQRVDELTIRVTAESGDESYDIDVKRPAMTE